jgi:hypothetical protein
VVKISRKIITTISVRVVEQEASLTEPILGSDLDEMAIVTRPTISIGLRQALTTLQIAIG